jgi:hypothetical protein
MGAATVSTEEAKMQTAVAAPVKSAVYHDRPATAVKPRLVEQLADKYGVDADKMLATLKATAFRQSGGADAQVNNEQMMMLLVVANEYNLNPFTREIYAFASQGGIVPIVSIDGWVRIVNEKPTFKGVAFEYGPPHPDTKFHGAPEWIQCTMIRSDRDVPVSVREYLVECYRKTGPWDSTTARMLRHRSYIQCGRIAFGFALHDEDEALRIIEGETLRTPETPKAIANINAAVKPPIAGEATREKDPPTTAPAGDQQAATQAGQTFTYAEVRQKIQDAKSLDDVDAAVSLIAGIPGLTDKLRTELTDAAKAERLRLQE